MTLVRRGMCEQAGAARDECSVGSRQLDLAVDDDDPGALVNLMFLELLAGREVDHDRA
jgi:hypothetical protein